jgi:hypothetical protein
MEQLLVIQQHLLLLMTHHKHQQIFKLIISLWLVVVLVDLVMPEVVVLEVCSRVPLQHLLELLIHLLLVLAVPCLHRELLRVVDLYQELQVQAHHSQQ